MTMMRIHPKNLIFIGFILVLFGAVAPFLMVIQIVRTTYVLSFAAFTASVAGLLLGLVGAAWYSRVGKD
jgi:hypothetical protein